LTLTRDPAAEADLRAVPRGGASAGNAGTPPAPGDRRHRSDRSCVRLAGTALLSLAAMGCGDGSGDTALIERRATVPPPLATCPPSPWANPEVSTVAAGLDTPWGMAVAADGRIFLTERPGRIRLIDEQGSRSEPWATLPVDQRGEAGLLGIALAPDFEVSGAVYVAGVYRESRGPEAALRFWNAMLRRLGADPATGQWVWVHRVEATERGMRIETVADGLPASVLHSGGAILFREPDRFLLSLGDARSPWTAQDTSDPRGSILEVTLPGTGQVARFGSGVRVVASGVRNSQGLVEVASGTVAFIEHGPTGFEVEGRRSGKDELNLLRPGANYGWPMEAGIPEAGRHTSPLVEWTAAIAPAGVAVLPHLSGDTSRVDIFVTGLRGQLRRGGTAPVPTTFRMAGRLRGGDCGRPPWSAACGRCPSRRRAPPRHQQPGWPGYPSGRR
jgi:aldose sugar dehydrogenase